MKNLFLMMMALVAFISGIVAAQEQSIKRVEFGPTETIQKAQASGERILVQTKRSERPYNLVHVYNLSGEKQFQIAPEKGSSFVDAFLLTSGNELIVIEQGSESTPTFQGFDDAIRVLDALTGAEKWRSSSNAGSYELSSDERYLLTRSPAEDGRFNGIEIIDLKERTKITPEIGKGGAQVAWFDSVRIAVAIQQVERIIDQEAFEKERKKEQDITDLRRQLGLLKYQFMKKRISKERYETDSSAIRAQLDSLNKPPATRGRGRRMPSSSVQHKLKATKLILYNIETGTQESESELVTDSQQPVAINAHEGLMPILTADEHQNLYVYGRVSEDRTFCKFDKDMNFLWSYNLPKVPHRFGVLAFEKQRRFRVIQGDDMVLLDSETGEPIKTEKVMVRDKQGVTVEFDLKAMSRSAKVYFSKKLRVTEDAKTLEISTN